MTAPLTEEAARLGPREAAEAILRSHPHNDDWLDAFAEHLDRRRAGEALSRILDVWGLSQSEAARLFGVSRQAVAKWVANGVPAERSTAVADLAAATDLLVHYLQRDRIPAVVRRPMPAREGASLLELLAAGDTRATLAACRAMFDFAAAGSR